MLSGIRKYLMVKLRMKNMGLGYVVAELLPGWPDVCLAAIDLYYGISAERGRKDYL